MEIAQLDIPFNYRYTCWFCGEGSHQEIAVLLSQYKPEKVYIPICDECKSYRCHLKTKSLAPLKEQIKAKIVSKSTIELSIGANWTEQELKESDMHGGAFDGFKKSGWKMYLIAKERINFVGWELSINGMSVEHATNEESFEFDGLTYTNFDSMLNSLSKSFSLNKPFLNKVITLYGNHRITEAVKFCRLVPNQTEAEREQAINDLINTLKEKDTLTQQNKQQKFINSHIKVNEHEITPVTIRNYTVPSHVIHWAMTNGVINFDVLDALENDFLDTFAHKTDEDALQLFNALESYIDKRLSSTTWNNQDPNQKLWEYVESACVSTAAQR